MIVWMRFMRFTPVHDAGVDEKHRGAQLGVGLIASCSALVLATVWFLPTTNNGRSVALAFVGVGMVISVAQRGASFLGSACLSRLCSSFRLLESSA
jgi:hypothetical protein